MRQLALALTPQPEESFASFVPGRNSELLEALRGLAEGSGNERFVYLWGATGSGRSHLLAAVAAAARAAGRCTRALDGSASASELQAVEPDVVLTIDAVERLDPSAQAALFGAFNRIREGRGALVASGSLPPAGLAVRSDLATRLGWGLVYVVQALSDEEKLEAMQARAHTLGFGLSAEIGNYLLRHGRRDLPSLLALVDLLDRHSLQAQRMVTLPLARTVLALAGARPAEDCGLNASLR